MLRVLVPIHRWLGIACAALFAMWFASGIVMHFVPFPQLSEAERFAGMAEIAASSRPRSATEALVATARTDIVRLRLVQRLDGLVYVAQARDGSLTALHANDLKPATVISDRLALTIAEDHGRRRGISLVNASMLSLLSHDQWSVPNGLDPHRPLHRVALNDTAGTEVYVSARTGEVVRDTTRFERGWNYAGSVVHWIYPTALRRNWLTWDRTVWAISLAALIVAVSGAALGIARLKLINGRPRSPYRGWHAWHHLFGIVSMTFVLTWIFSGWLSMDHGRLFSTGRASPAELAAISGPPLSALGPDSAERPLASGSKEIEWFVFGDVFHRRDRQRHDAQVLLALDRSLAVMGQRSELTADEVQRALARTERSCDRPTVVAKQDDYPISTPASSPVYRSVCGQDWLHVDASSGAVLELLDPSRRTYRWLYSALHTLDLPVLTPRPALRSTIIVALCSLGLAFSLTGIVIGWRRLVRMRTL